MSAPRKKKADDDDDADEEWSETVQNGASDPELQQAVDARGKEVLGMLQGGNVVGAFQKALEDPPVLAKADSIKEANAGSVLKCILQAKDTDIERVTGSLSQHEIDVLMKYLYRLLRDNPDASGKLLKWHGKVLAKGGIGCIVRALVDRQTV